MLRRAHPGLRETDATLSILARQTGAIKRFIADSDGTRYDVNDPTQFVQWTSANETCSGAIAAQTGISRELYGLVCEASARRLFSTVLTPNYNEVHRNHFHLDIGQSGPASGFIVRSQGWPNVDLSLYGDE